MIIIKINPDRAQRLVNVLEKIANVFAKAGTVEIFVTGERAYLQDFKDLQDLKENIEEKLNYINDEAYDKPKE